ETGQFRVIEPVGVADGKIQCARRCTNGYLNVGGTRHFKTVFAAKQNGDVEGLSRFDLPPRGPDLVDLHRLLQFVWLQDEGSRLYSELLEARVQRERERHNGVGRGLHRDAQIAGEHVLDDQRLQVALEFNSPFNAQARCPQCAFCRIDGGEQGNLGQEWRQ